MTTLESIGIDTDNSPFRSADLLLSGKLSKLIAYTKELEEHHIRMKKGLMQIANVPESDLHERNPPSYSYYAKLALGELLPEIDVWNPCKSVVTESP
jgi:hypothetical protein